MRPVERLWLGRKLILVAGDVLVFLIALEVTFYFRDPSWPSLGLIVGPFLPVVGFCILSAYAAGLYELRVIRDFVALVGGLLASSIACCVFGTTYFYLMAPHIRFAPKITLLLTIAGAHVGMLAWRRLILATTGFNVVDLRILVLGDVDYQESLRAEFSLADRFSEDVSLIVVDRRWSSRNAVEARHVLSSAIATQVPVMDIDEFHESLVGKVSPQHAQDLAWALDHVLPRSGSVYFKAKRLMDIFVAAVFGIVLAPVIAAVALAILVMDRASPLYSQIRIGYLGRPFRLWKFRTMRSHADLAGPFTQVFQARDPRITPLGYALRRLRIDELPQLWNVLTGEMSLVGPRPDWAKEADILEKSIPTYSLRYLVPPGITGWAQVYFRAASNYEDSIEKHNYDLYYLKNFSLALDFSIILKTAKRVCIGDARVDAIRPINPPSDSDVRIDIASIVGRS